MESSLADTYRELIAGVGFDLGWGRGADFAERAWDDRKLTTLKEVVKNGLRQFYHPPPDQAGVSHQWSFLKPLGRVTLPQASKTVRLPDDFKGLVGPVGVLVDGGGYVCKVTGRVRAKYAVYPDSTGQPEMIEVEPLKDTTRERGQRSQFVVWPLADADYTLEFHYSILGAMLSGELPYAYGGAEHASTIRASCLAWAELHLDDLADGPKQAYWRERLAASISMDRQREPASLGYNADYSDLRETRYGDRRDFVTTWPPVRFYGEVPDAN